MINQIFNGQLINPATASKLSLYLKNPTTPLMLTGEDGTGKYYIARLLSMEILKLKYMQDLEKHPYYLVIERQIAKQDISIDQIRQLIKSLKLKTAGQDNLRRVVLIKDAQFMNEEAQNALLKLLEEPNRDTLFILTSSSHKAVLPTLASRTQIVAIQPISLTEAKKFYADMANSEIESAWRLSQGNAGLLNALLTADKHQLKLAVQQAKDFLSQSRSERLMNLDELAKSKDNFKQFLKALGLVLIALHHSSIEKNHHKLAKKLIKDRQLIYKSEKYLAANSSTKLLIDDLSLNLHV